VNKLIPLTLAALGLATPASAQITAFQHVILVIQENRTPDNLFQGLCTPTTTNPKPCSTKPSSQQYNIQTSGWLDNTSSKGWINPKAVQFGLNYDIMHSHAAFTAMCDWNASSSRCMMDGAAHEACDRVFKPCPTGAAFGYVDNSAGVLNPYLELVKEYGWGNYMFQTNQGPSYPAHQFLFGATSAPSAADDGNGIFAAENTAPAGCAAPGATRVWLINPKGVEFRKIFPCFEHQTVADLLETRAVTWRYYGSRGVAGEWRDTAANGIWMAPNSIKHICLPVVNRTCTGAMWTPNVEFNPTAILSDISSCNLQGVSWVTPDSFNSDHTGDVRNTGGPSWVASIYNAVGQSKCKNPDGSSYWNSTAIIVTWDDWGGWYDHEPPLIEASPQGGYQMGFRVPLIVVSAYTPAGLISNTPEDFGSVIRFIEQNFGIREGKLNFADARASLSGTGDLTEFFPSGNPPRGFKPIKAPLSAKDFLKSKPSGLPVDDD
jgi:phospholipase C